MGKDKQRRKMDAALKAKVALAAIRGEQTTAQICSAYGVHSSQVAKWKKRALEALPGAFTEGSSRDAGGADEQTVSALYEEIGRLKVEADFLKKKLERCL